MRVAEAYAAASRDDIMAALAGGTLVIYSTARPPAADHKVTRNAALATFAFASPAFAPDAASPCGAVVPNLIEVSVEATAVGTPSFARAFTAEGAVVADLSAGPGATEVKLSEVSTSAGQPIAVVAMRLPLPAENVTWDKTAFGHVFVTNNEEPHRKLSVRG
jgi:hypothetical protein